MNLKMGREKNVRILDREMKGGGAMHSIPCVGIPW